MKNEAHTAVTEGMTFSALKDPLNTCLLGVKTRSNLTQLVLVYGDGENCFSEDVVVTGSKDMLDNIQNVLEMLQDYPRMEVL